MDKLPSASDFKSRIEEILTTAKQSGLKYVDIVSGDLHRS